ncbi:hypothetical protein NQ317_002321 [Molorchus minor]|uniref:YTH domain-containing protein n=1 Tax=Molorchus minor TaxID=1323400 RepID=A0ABQ9J585_9CUCU|nr:hypothetical protein NQ317_002321 [Molorchus minor]
MANFCQSASVSPSVKDPKSKDLCKVRWIYVKDVPNVQLSHIQLENNDNKPVTNSRDTQEVPHEGVFRYYASCTPTDTPLLFSMILCIMRNVKRKKIAANSLS